MPQAPHLPQECFPSLHKAPLFFPCLNLSCPVFCICLSGEVGLGLLTEKGEGAPGRGVALSTSAPSASFSSQVPGEGLQ